MGFVMSKIWGLFAAHGVRAAAAPEGAGCLFFPPSPRFLAHGCGGTQEVKVIIVGLDNAGKTTTLYKLRSAGEVCGLF